jgi:hypothetical protein
MKVTYCQHLGCHEKRIPRWASNVCVSIGSFAVSAVVAIKSLGGLAQLKTLPLTFDNLWMPATMATLVVVFAIFLSLFERFDNPLTALIYGASTPALLLGFANMAIPDFAPLNSGG